MGKKIKNSEEVQKVEEIKLDVFQACNEFRLIRLIRSHIMKKFYNEKHTKNEWEKIFKDERCL